MGQALSAGTPLGYLLLNGGMLLLHLLLLPGSVQSQMVQLEKGQGGNPQTLGSTSCTCGRGELLSPGFTWTGEALPQALPLSLPFSGGEGVESREPRGAKHMRLDWRIASGWGKG